MKTRAILCRRSDGTPVADERCTSAKPQDFVVEANYSGCTYEWKPTEWSDWSSTCSDAASRSRSAICVQVETNTSSPDRNCAAARPELTETASRTEGCSADWEVGGWGSFSSTCSDTAVRSRAVSCKRSDGKILPDTACTEVRPNSSETQGIYESCGYRWGATEWGDFNSQCSMNATRTGDAVCLRSDGAVVEDALCPGTNPGSVAETKPNYAGCGYHWMYSSGSIPTSQQCSSGALNATISST